MLATLCDLVEDAWWASDARRNLGTTRYELRSFQSLEGRVDRSSGECADVMKIGCGHFSPFLQQDEQAQLRESAVSL